jgi:hypothetical protein
MYQQIKFTVIMNNALLYSRGYTTCYRAEALKHVADVRH